MNVLETFKKSFFLFKQTFLPLFLILAIFPFVEMLISPILDNYLILQRFTIVDIVSFILAMLTNAVGFIVIDTLFYFKPLKFQEIFTKAVEVLWPFFLFQLVLLFFGLIVAMTAFLPVFIFIPIIVSAIYLSFRVSLATLLIILEHETVARAFDRSFLMTKGKVASIFGVMILLVTSIMLVAVVIFFTLIIPFYHIDSLASLYLLLPNDFLLEFFFTVVFSTILIQFSYTTFYTIYKELSHETVVLLEDDNS